MYVFSHLYLFAVNVYRSQHEIHADRVAVSLYVDPVFESLNHARLTDARISDQNDFEEKVILVLYDAEVY